VKSHPQRLPATRGQESRTPVRALFANLTRCISAAPLVIAACLLIGCASPRGLQDRSASAPSEAEGVFVIGVQPAGTKIWFNEGAVGYDHFVPTPGQMSTVIGVSEEGFIVGRVKGGTTLGIMHISFPFTPTTSRAYAPCGNNKAHVFTVPAGKVVYVGTVDYRPNGISLSSATRQELDTALRFLDAQHPSLRGRLESAPLRGLTTTRSCFVPTPTQIVPVYVPAKKK
jgi:hypothetical protein